LLLSTNITSTHKSTDNDPSTLEAGNDCLAKNQETNT